MIILHPRSLDRHWMNECDEWKCLVLLDAHAYVRTRDELHNQTNQRVRASLCRRSVVIPFNPFPFNHTSFIFHARTPFRVRRHFSKRSPPPAPKDATDRATGRDPICIFTVYNPEKKDNCTVYPYTHIENTENMGEQPTKITNRSIQNGMFPRPRARFSSAGGCAFMHACKRQRPSPTHPNRGGTRRVGKSNENFCFIKTFQNIE